MSKVKDIFDTLNSSDKGQLMIAFNDNRPFYIELENKRFIGINITNIPHLKEEEKIGEWSLGVISHGGSLHDNE